MVEVGYRFPCGFPDRVAGPFDEILAVFSGSSAIQKSFYFVLEFIVDDDRGGRFFALKGAVIGFE
jgi:hypothetical protein